MFSVVICNAMGGNWMVVAFHLMIDKHKNIHLSNLKELECYKTTATWRCDTKTSTELLRVGH